MKENKPEIITVDPWSELKTFTDARISLGRCGVSLPLKESLSFKLAHARARDAVHLPFKIDELKSELEGSGHTCLKLKSSTDDRMEYLTRPDKGRVLSAESRELLEKQETGYDVCVAVGDGLSSRAIHENGYSFVDAFMPLLEQAGIKATPVCLIENSRVAIADEIGSMLSAKLSVILIGERPGLSSPNSMGIYLTYNPKPGTTDEARNCISNVRDGGLSIAEGVQKLAYLVEQALITKKSGVELKDKMPSNYLPFNEIKMLVG